MQKQPLDIKNRFTTLEQRLQVLMDLHQSLKSASRELQAENRRLVLELEEERNRAKRLDEGYRNLKDQEQTVTRQQVDRINHRINELVLEIDKNLKLIEV